MFITCFSCSHFVGTSDKQGLPRLPPFLRELCKRSYSLGRTLDPRGLGRGFWAQNVWQALPAQVEFLVLSRYMCCSALNLANLTQKSVAQCSGPAQVQLTLCPLPCSPSTPPLSIKMVSRTWGRSALAAVPMPAITTHRRRACQARGTSPGLQVYPSRSALKPARRKLCAVSEDRNRTK